MESDRPAESGNESDCRRRSLRTNRGIKQKVVGVFEDGFESEIGLSDAELQKFFEPVRPNQHSKKKRARDSPEQDISESYGLISNNENEEPATVVHVDPSSQNSIVEGPSTPTVYATKSKPKDRKCLRPQSSSTPVKHQKFYLGRKHPTQKQSESSDTDFLSEIERTPLKDNEYLNQGSPKDREGTYSVSLPFFSVETGEQLNWEDCKGKLITVEFRFELRGKQFSEEASIYFPRESDVGWPVPLNTFDESRKVEELLHQYKDNTVYYPLSNPKQSRLGDNSTYLGFKYYKPTVGGQDIQTPGTKSKTYGNLYICVVCHWCVLDGRPRTKWMARLRSLGTYDNHQSKKHNDFSGTNRRVYERKANGSRTYTHNVPDPNTIEKSLVEAFVSANLAPNVVDNLKFRNFIKALNPGFILPKRRKLTQLVKQLADKVSRDRLKEFSANLNVIGGTLQIDGWSDRHRFAVLGIIFTYCDLDMHFRRVMLACEHHRLRSTGINIASFVKKVVERNHLQGKVKFTITDSGANMLCAMGLLEEEICEDEVGQEDSENWTSFDSDAENDKEQCQLDRRDNSDESSLETINDEEAAFHIGVQAAPCTEGEWGLSALMSRNVCNVHKAQLIIADLANKKRGCQLFIDELQYVKDIINFIRDHHITLVLLKELSGKTLRTYCKTRWNVFCLVLERITEPKVFTAVAAILRTAETHVNRSKVMPPQPPSVTKYLLWQYLYHLLSPIMDLSNQLQSDGITCHLVIPTIIKTFLSIHQTPVPREDWKACKEIILTSFIERFKPVCHNKIWIIAALMTYASYTRNTFKWYHVLVVPLLNGDPFNLPTEIEAIKIAESAIPVETRVVKSKDTVEFARQITKKLRLHDALNTTYSDNEDSQLGNATNSESTMQGTVLNVFDMYLNEYKKLLAKNFQSKPPEACWRYFLQEKPQALRLFNFIRQIYSLPASTASVERLFSQIGNVFTAKRNRLHMSNVERIVMLKCAVDENHQNFKKLSQNVKFRLASHRLCDAKGFRVEHLPYDDSVTEEKIEEMVAAILKPR